MIPGVADIPWDELEPEPEFDDPEVEAIHDIAGAMTDLDPDVQARIARWVFERYATRAGAMDAVPDPGYVEATPDEVA